MEVSRRFEPFGIARPRGPEAVLRDLRRGLPANAEGRTLTRGAG
jgi:hypothetical protein